MIAWVSITKEHSKALGSYHAEGTFDTFLLRGRNPRLLNVHGRKEKKPLVTLGTPPQTKVFCGVGLPSLKRNPDRYSPNHDSHHEKGTSNS